MMRPTHQNVSQTHCCPAASLAVAPIPKSANHNSVTSITAHLARRDWPARGERSFAKSFCANSRPSHVSLSQLQPFCIKPRRHSGRRAFGQRHQMTRAPPLRTRLSPPRSQPPLQDGPAPRRANPPQHGIHARRHPHHHHHHR